MAASEGASRFLGLTWSTFQPQLGLLPIDSNRTAGSALARAFVSAKLIQASDCVLRANAEVPDVLDLVDQEALEATSLLVVYVCSHGIFPFNAPYRLATSRTKHADDVGRSLILGELLQAMSRSPATTKLLIVDACFSGNAATQLAEQTLSFSGLQSPGECTVIAATSPLAVASAGQALDEAPQFTSQLIASVDEVRSRASGKITLAAIYDVTRERLVAQGAAAPQLFSVNQGADRVLPRSGSGDVGLLLSPRAEPGVRVLYVDDEEDWRDPFSEQVSRDGVQVDTAETADTARQLLTSRFYDLVVVDLFLADDAPATELIELVGEVSDADLFIATRLGKGGAEAWAQLDSIFAYPSAIDAVYFKNRGEHVRAARDYCAELLSERTRVLSLVEGASDVAAQVASRVAGRVLAGHKSPPDHQRLLWLELEALALLHETLLPWLDPDSDTDQGSSPYVDSFVLAQLGGGRSSCAVFTVSPRLSAFEDPPVAQLVLKIGPKDEIQEEVTRYDRFVQVGIPLSIRTDKLRDVYGAQLGAVLYSFLGEDASAIEELGDASRESMLTGMKGVLSPRGRRWYASKPRENTHFLDYYERHGFGYAKFVGAIEQCDAALRSLTKTEPEPRSLHLDLLDSGAIGGGTPAVLVHGDLHLANLVRYGADRCGLIDYRNVGIGPRLVDFATLEIDCWLRGITPELARYDLLKGFDALWALLLDMQAGMPRTENVEDLQDLLDDKVDDLRGLPDWCQGRVEPIALCRRAAYGNFGDVPDAEYAAQLWLASIRRASFSSAWVSADERRALSVAPLAIAHGCEVLLRDRH